MSDRTLYIVTALAVLAGILIALYTLVSVDGMTLYP